MNKLDHSRVIGAYAKFEYLLQHAQSTVLVGVASSKLAILALRYWSPIRTCVLTQNTEQESLLCVGRQAAKVACLMKMVYVPW